MTHTTSSKRNQILQTTLGLIAENGFHGTAVSMVASEANVGMGTIYRYFENKEQLINELYREIKADIIKASITGSQEDVSIQAHFALTLRNLANYYMTHPKELSFMEQYANSPFINKISEQERRELEAPIYQFFHFAQGKGAMKAIPLEILIVNVHATIVSLVKLHITGGFSLTEEAIEMAISMSWDAVKR